jgi:hypothetical protein
MCRSGKAYKACCANLTHLPKKASTDLRWRYWGKHVDEVLYALLSYLSSKGLLEDIRHDAEVELLKHSRSETEEGMIDLLTEEELLPAVDAFMLFHLEAEVPPDDAANEGVSDVNRGDSDEDVLLYEIGVIVASAEKFFMEEPYKRVFVEMLHAPFSWFRVVAVKPHESLTLHDLFLDRTVTVRDRAASLTARRGAIICGKVLLFDDIALLTGVVSRMLPPASLNFATEMADTLRPSICSEFEADLDESLLCHIAPLVVSTFLTTYLSFSAEPPPTLLTTDGDPLEPTLLTFGFRGSTVQEMANSIVDLLEPIPDAPAPTIEKRDRRGHPTRITIGYVKQAAASTVMDTIVAALIRVERHKVTVEVSSSKRADHMQEILGRLGDRLTFISRGEPPMTEPTGALQPEQLTPEILGLLEEKMRDYQEKWLTTPVPALNGMTPIEASQSVATRPLLEALLDDFALREERARVQGDSMRTFNVEELRVRLGLTDQLN